MADDDDIPDSFKGQDLIDEINRRKAKAQSKQKMTHPPQELEEEEESPMPTGPRMPQAPKVSSHDKIDITNYPSADPKVRAEEHSKKEAERAEQKRIYDARAFAAKHPILVGTGRALVKIVGKGNQTIQSKGNQFIKNQDQAERDMRELQAINTSDQLYGKKSKKKSSSKDEEEFDENDDGGVGEPSLPMKKGKGSWLSNGREYGNGETSTLVASAYRPPTNGKDAPFGGSYKGTSLVASAYKPPTNGTGAPFDGNYKSLGVPVTYKFNGHKKASDEDMIKSSDRMSMGINKELKMPVGKIKKGEKGGVSTSDVSSKVPSMPGMSASGVRFGSIQQDNSGLGEYQAIGNPITLKNQKNAFNQPRNEPIPNSLYGITLGGLGTKPSIPRPVMMQQSVAMPTTESTLPKKVNLVRGKYKRGK